MRYVTTVVFAGCLAGGLVTTAAPSVTAAQSASTQAARAQAERDTQEVQGYRLSMPVILKLNAVYKAAAAEEQKDPRRQQLAKKKAELKLLESKDEPTEAEQERMAVLGDEVERLEEGDDGQSEPEAKSLSDMARRIESKPPLAAAVRAAGMTPREFATAQLALVQTGLALALLKASPAGTPPPPGVLKENLEFVRLHEKELEALLAGWGEQPSSERP